MRVFLTGATGFVGRHLCKALVEADHQVVAFTRRPVRNSSGGEASSEERGVTWVAGDLYDVETLREGMAGCQAVIHLIGIIREKSTATFTRVHVGGTEQVINAMQHLGITRLLHMSALGAGQKGPAGYFRTKWQAEELLRATGLAYTIFRPSLIFGPGDGFISTLVKQLRYYPVTPIIGTGDYQFAPISVYAVCAAFVQALQLNGPTLAKTCELCGPQVLSYTQILDILAAHLHVHKPRVHLKPTTMSTLLRLAGLLHLPMPVTTEEMQMLLLGSVCSDESARTVFELPQITLEEGIKEYLRGGTKKG